MTMGSFQTAFCKRNGNNCCADVKGIHSEYFIWSKYMTQSTAVTDLLTGHKTFEETSLSAGTA